MEAAAQVVLVVSGVSVTVILEALLVIARRDRRKAGGRTSIARSVVAPREGVSTIVAGGTR